MPGAQPFPPLSSFGNTDRSLSPGFYFPDSVSRAFPSRAAGSWESRRKAGPATGGARRRHWAWPGLPGGCDGVRLSGREQPGPLEAVAGPGVSGVAALSGSASWVARNQNPQRTWKDGDVIPMLSGSWKALLRKRSITRNEAERTGSTSCSRHCHLGLRTRLACGFQRPPRALCFPADIGIV